MTLADALRAFAIDARISPTKNPRQPLLAKVRERVEALFGQGVPATSLGVSEAIEQVLAAHMSGSWNSIGSRELRLCSPVVLSRDYPIVGDEPLFQAFLSHLSAVGGRSAFGGVVSSFLTSFAPDSAQTKRAGDFLRANKKRLPRRWTTVPAGVDLFDPAKGPDQLGQRISQAEQPLAVLRAFHLTGPLRAGQFADHAFLRFCQNLRDVIRVGDGSVAFERFREIAMDGDTAVYPRRLDAVADALLAPWRTRAPNADLRNKIKELLIEGYGDPRFAKHRWESVPEDVRAVLMHWIAEDSLEFFLNIAEHHANHMWPARRKFWSAFIAKRAVGNIWVVFGTNAAREARRRKASGEVPASASFGLLNGSQVQDRSVLLMTIDRVTIAEWSHNGMVRIWYPGNRSAPKPFQPESTPYEANQLRSGADFQQRHFPDRSWQVTVANEIQRQTGVNVSPRDYM